jgi:hypothetical protein
MKPYLSALCMLGAALVIAAAGIFGLIDENMMIMLVIVLTICTPYGRGSCRSRCGER